MVVRALNAGAASCSKGGTHRSTAGGKATVSITGIMVSGL
jgi:hypothetical protein